MLFLIMGASGSGKSSTLTGLKQFLPDVDWRDFDDALKHPSNTAERQLTTEYWLKVAIQNQTLGISTGVVGTTVLGEVLACPSAPKIAAVEAVLLDCADVIRIDRIRARDGLESSLASQDMLCWAAWLRMHASDPQWRQDVVQLQGASDMNWKSWSSWKKGDARWKVTILDNSHLSVEETTSSLVDWANKRSINQARSDPYR